MDAVLSCMAVDALGPGERAARFAASVAAYLEVAGGVAFRERARAVEAVYIAAGLGEGSAIAVSALAPMEYLTVAARRGIRVLVVDVERDCPCIAVAALEPAGSVDAIVIDTALGFVADMEGIENPGVTIIEDITEGFGANTGTRRAGTIGRFCLIGVEAGDVLTAGGGTVACAKRRKDAGLLHQVREELGAGVLMPDMNAALGEIQLAQVEKFVEVRRQIAERLVRALARSRHTTIVQPRSAENVYSGFAVRVADGVPEILGYAKKHDIEVAFAFAGSVIAHLVGHPDVLPAAAVLVSGSGADESGGSPQSPPADVPEASASPPSESSTEAGGSSEEGTPSSEEGPPLPEAGSEDALEQSTATTATPHDSAQPVRLVANAHAFYLRCLRLPLYPSLTGAETERIERFIRTMP